MKEYQVDGPCKHDFKLLVELGSKTRTDSPHLKLSILASQVILTDVYTFSEQCLHSVLLYALLGISQVPL